VSETVYIETSVIGYLAVRPSNNLIFMANLEITRRWWETRRSQFTLYISQVVLDEAGQGDAKMASKRLERSLIAVGWVDGRKPSIAFLYQH
jgi:hypothetical protein